jgi:hypothetical protein
MSWPASPAACIRPREQARWHRGRGATPGSREHDGPHRNRMMPNRLAGLLVDMDQESVARFPCGSRWRQRPWP